MLLNCKPNLLDGDVCFPKLAGTGVCYIYPTKSSIGFFEI